MKSLKSFSLDFAVEMSYVGAKFMDKLCTAIVDEKLFSKLYKAWLKQTREDDGSEIADEEMPVVNW